MLASGDMLAYAFGQSIAEYRGTRRVSHSGSHRGYRAHLARFPARSLNIIALSNLEEFDPAGAALQVADLFLKAEPLDSFAGTYYSEELQSTYTVTLKGTTLHLRHRRHPDLPLTKTGRDTFSTDAW